MLVDECPWCLVKVQFQLVSGPTPAGLDSEGQLVEQILACPSCQRHTYQVGGGSPVDQPVTRWQLDEVRSQWPAPGQREPHESIPAAIASDWSEARKCFGIRTYKATAAMARRAVQGICIDKGAKKDHLVNQVKQLVNDGRLHPHLGEWANEVRILGNTGAHPGDDGLDFVSQEEAADVLNFLDEMLKWVYVMPFDTDRARQRRTS